MMKGICMPSWLQRGICVCILCMTPVLFARVSVGLELTPLLSTGIVSTYDHARIRYEAGVHFFLYDYLRELNREEGSAVFCEQDIVFKGSVSVELTNWKRHALYGGFGAVCLVDNWWENYMVGVGPSVTYVWKNHKRNRELNIGLQVPLLFKHDYEHDPHDDFPGSEGFVAVTLIWMAPTIGISWAF